MSDEVKAIDWAKLNDLIKLLGATAPVVYAIVLQFLEVLNRKQPMRAGAKASHCPELKACHEAAIKAQVEALAHLVHACECCEEC